MIRDQGESMKKEIIEQRSNKKQGGGGQAACEQPEGGRASQAEGRARAEPQRKQKSGECCCPSDSEGWQRAQTRGKAGVRVWPCDVVQFLCS